MVLTNTDGGDFKMLKNLILKDQEDQKWVASLWGISFYLIIIMGNRAPESRIYHAQKLLLAYFWLKKFYSLLM